jgi:translation initiation factor 3 subunit E
MSSDEAGAGAATPVVQGPSPAHDLTQKFAPFLDVHLLLPIFDFVGQLDIYSPDDLAKARLAVIKHTNMADYMARIYQKVHGEDASTAEYKELQTKVVAEIDRFQEVCAPLLELIDGPDADTDGEAGALFEAKRWNMEYLSANHGITEDMVDDLYAYAKFLWECGSYEPCLRYLKYFRELAPTAEMASRALWGKFAAEILCTNWEAANMDRELLRGSIEQSEEGKLMQLQQRSWLLHWSLFVFYHHPDGRDQLVDFFMSDANLDAIRNNCPWLLRYLAVTVVVNKRKRTHILRRLTTILQDEAHNYSDPITEFVLALLVNFDFEEAQAKLASCESVIRSDYFLSRAGARADEYVREFLEAARLYVFETYCLIHKTIEFDMLAAKLNMPVEEAERWVVELIRNARLPAKIDDKAKQVIMTHTHPTVHEDVLEHTKDLAFRTRMLADELTKGRTSSSSRGDKHRGSRR